MANEKRLIDANALLEKMQYRLPQNDAIAELINECVEIARKQVLIAPTVDAVEVVHGQWFVIEDDYFDLVELKCSACGESWGFEDYEDCIPQNYYYCPNCGAKMDGGVKKCVDIARQPLWD